MIDDNRYALLWTSQISNRRHVEDLEFAYRILRHRFGFPAANIKVLCYDGTIGATDATAAQMATWVGDGTPYQMKVDASATKAHLQSTLTDLSNKMNSSSLLFVHTNNHGSPSGLCVDNSSVLTPTEWGSMLDGMKSFGTLVVTMEQCYSGAFSQPTLDHSQASQTSFAAPCRQQGERGRHADPWARPGSGVNSATSAARAWRTIRTPPPATDQRARGLLLGRLRHGTSTTTRSTRIASRLRHHIYLTKAPADRHPRGLGKSLKRMSSP
jgi:hypothetical protein